MDEGIRYKPEHYAQQFLKNLSHLRTTDAFCDVTLRVGDAEFRAHRTVLAAASPYFQVSSIYLLKKFSDICFLSALVGAKFVFGVFRKNKKSIDLKHI